jgi:hypothetical protein
MKAPSGAFIVEPCCGDCAFYVESSQLVELEKLGSGFASGYCHRFPPQVLLDRPDCFPETAREDFCGEFFPSSLPKEETGKDKSDMQYRAVSSRIREDHGTNFFSRFRDKAEAWAKQEAKAGFPSVVFELQETEVCRFDPPPPLPPAEEEPAKEKAK